MFHNGFRVGDVPTPVTDKICSKVWFGVRRKSVDLFPAEGTSHRGTFYLPNDGLSTGWVLSPTATGTRGSV